MERLQFIGLALEMFGFGLAIMNSFYDSISKSIDGFVRKSLDKLGTNDFFFTMAAVDYDDTISPEDKDNIAFRRFFFVIILFSSFWFWFIYIDLGNFILWLIPEFIFSILLAFLTYLLIRLVVIFILLNIIIGLIDFFGRKDFVLGVGTIIGVIGLFINTYQVLMSEYFWGAIILWGLVLFSIYIYWNEKKS